MMRKTSSRLATQGLNALRGAATSTGSNAVTEKRYQGTAATESSGDSDKTLFYTPEEGYWRTSPFETVSAENITLDKYVWRNFSNYEKKISTVCVATGRQYTYAELRDHTAAFAVRLQNKFKLKPRDVVAICLPNLPEYPIAALGAVEAGLVVTTVNPVYTAEEIARQLIVSDTKFVVGFGKVFNTLKEACAIAKKNIPIVVIRTKTSEPLPEGAIDFYETTNTTDVDFSTLKDPGINPNEMVFLPFSSGTTGLPKGVMLSHNNITINCNQMQTKFPYETFLQTTTEDHQEVVPCVLPFFHIYGLTVCMLSKIFLGVKMVTLPQFKPDDLLKALHEYKATSLNLVPPIALFLTHSPKATAEIAPRLKSVMTGAAPIGKSDVERFLKKFPHTEFCQGYGMTETSPTTIMTPNKCTKYDTIGQLIPNTDGKIVAMDECDGRGVGPNIIGELYIRGPQVMNGYFQNPEANADIFRDSTSGKWLRTGDVGYYDEEGMFYITDRVKELIKVKGFQVPPAELEACLRSHPDIIDAAVIGIPHDQYGEVPKGVVVLKANTKVTEEEIKEFVAGKVAHYKQLEGGVVFVKDIPKNPTGKIMRKDLRAQYC